jgi:hypothetical protein
MLSFNTLADAYHWYMKSDLHRWDWFPGFDEEQPVQFLYRHSNGARSEEHLVMLFLQCQGQDVTQYFDSSKRQRAGWCMFCSMVLWQTSSDVPDADDDWRWWELGNEHAYNCKWVETRAQQMVAH